MKKLRHREVGKHRLHTVPIFILSMKQGSLCPKIYPHNNSYSAIPSVSTRLPSHDMGSTTISSPSHISWWISSQDGLGGPSGPLPT